MKKISLTFMKIALIAVALFGSIGVANAQNPFTVTPSSSATWDATSKILTISGDAATIANANPEEVINARIRINDNVKSMTLNGVNIHSSDVTDEEDNCAVKYLATSGVLALTIEGMNHIKAGETAAMVSMAMNTESSFDSEEGSSININGSGTLNLISSKGAASYGFYSAYGHFVISGGTVNITSGEATQYNSYGIGSYDGNITINGGTVNIIAGKGPIGSYAINTNSGITINGGSGTAKTTEAYAKTKRAFSKKPIGALAPSPWDVKEASWGITTINSTVSQSISIYPNPAAEVLTIKSESEVSLIEVFDVAGRKQLEWIKGKSVDVGGLNQGNYVVRVHTTDGVFTKKFVKE